LFLYWTRCFGITLLGQPFFLWKVIGTQFQKSDDGRGRFFMHNFQHGWTTSYMNRGYINQMQPDSNHSMKWLGVFLVLACLFCTQNASLWKRSGPDGTERTHVHAGQRPAASNPDSAVVSAATDKPAVETLQAKEPETATGRPDPSEKSDDWPYDISQYTAIEVVATGYYAGPESTGKKPGHPGYGITYSGVKVRRQPQSLSTIAADPEVFPIGTVLYVPGYGLGVVADTGNAIKGNKIDLYFETKDQIYREWGKKTVTVYLIRKGEGRLNEFMLDSLSRTVLPARTKPPAA